MYTTTQKISAQEYEKQTFLSTCRENNFSIVESRLQLLEKYVSLILFHNKNLNLISRKDEENIWTHHILHCVSLLFHRKFPNSGNILDLGTGGGLPGIVYAILHPELKFILLDATRKKIEAVGSMIADMKLKNVEAVWGRAEEVGNQPEYAGKFYIVIARAVAPLDKLVKWAKPFLAPLHRSHTMLPDYIPSRSLVAFKGGDLNDEIKRISNKKTARVVDSITLNTKEDKKVVIIRYP